jgi:hypothetical protein
VILSVTFADGVPIPVGDLDYEVALAVGDTLATEPAVWSETRREGQFLVFRIGHFRKSLDAFTDDAVAGRAGTDASARVVDFNSVGEGDIENTAGQAGMTVGNPVWIHLHYDIHRQERYGELLRRRRRSFLVDVGIRAAHTNMVTALEGGG